jgi:hypothetical protein
MSDDISEGLVKGDLICAKCGIYVLDTPKILDALI